MGKTIGTIDKRGLGTIIMLQVYNPKRQIRHFVLVYTISGVMEYWRNGCNVDIFLQHSIAPVLQYATIAKPIGLDNCDQLFIRY